VEYDFVISVLCKGQISNTCILVTVHLFRDVLSMGNGYRHMDGWLDSFRRSWVSAFLPIGYARRLFLGHW
jgi:hypothetical protein